MKVSNTGPGNITSGVAGTATTGAKETTSKNSRSAAAEALGASVGNSTKVDLSPRAQEMKRVKEMATPGGVDDAKVARLQALIDSGQYKVDARAVADKLIDEQMKMNE
jgi:negative regulator of flagellin synthesis FlgM